MIFLSSPQEKTPLSFQIRISIITTIAMPPKTFLFFLILSFTRSSSQTYYDCENEGCTWEGPSVCGTNGVSYANECLAFCQVSLVFIECITNFTHCIFLSLTLICCDCSLPQDMPVASLGLCSGGGGGVASVPYDNGTNVTLATMQRFQEEDFILTGRRNLEELAFPESPKYDNDESHEKIAPEQPLFWSRFTYDGYEYTAVVTDDDRRRLVSYAAPSTIRSLAVFGADTRQIVPNNHNRLPYSAICELDYGFGLSEGGCTGALIGKSSILTAGHCLYNYAQQQYTSPLRMAPGRYRQGTSTIEPYGLFGFRYSTVLTAYLTTGDRQFDIGVATYNSNSQGFPGNVAGTLCLAPATAQKLNAQTVVAGYAADFPDGSLVEAKGCSLRLSSNSQMILHDCDTASGQSGSPVLSSSQIIGVHIGFDPNAPANIALAWNNATYSSIYAWAPDAKSCVEVVNNPRSCANCATVQRPFLRLVCFVLCQFSGGGGTV